MFNLIRKQNGFSLPEIIIAGTIMSIMSLGIAQMITSQASSISYMEDRLARTNLDKYLSSIIEQSPDVCTSSLSGLVLEPTKASDFVLKDKDGVTIFNPAQASTNTYDNLKITSVKYKDVDVHSSASGQGKINITIQPERIRKGGGSQIMSPIVLEQTVAMDTSNNQITGCLSGSVSNLTCVLKDLTTYASGDVPPNRITGYGTPGDNPIIDKSFKVPSNSKAVRLFLNSGGTVDKQYCDDNHSCTTPKVDLIFYPGETKIGGTLFKKDGLLRLRTTEFQRGEISSCSGSSETQVVVYKQDWFYDGKLLVSVTGDMSKNNCPTYDIKFPALNTNTLPPTCPIISGRNVSSEPINLGFEIYQ